MESLPLICRAPHPPTTSFKAYNNGYFCFDSHPLKSTLSRRRIRRGKGVVRASVDPRSRNERIDGNGIERSEGGGGGYTGSAMEVTTFNQSFGDAADFPVWDKIGAVVRLSYGVGCFSDIVLNLLKLGIYGAMALAGRFICSLTGIDSSGGFGLSFDAIIQGLGYATLPIMALLFILDDEVVKVSPHARAIRDVEDEELRSFFYGMSPWQFILIVAASSVGEELFYRAAVQFPWSAGALADVFLRSSELVADVRGMAAVAGVLPPFVPFAQAFAAVITAALTGSLYYIAASPKDPTYVVAPVLQSRSGHEDLKKLFAERASTVSS
ncbi:Sporulation-killing factor biosynthesis protein SkfC [Bienertia sinuspersici]